MTTTINNQHLWNKPFILCLVNNLFLFIFYFAQVTILPIYITQSLGGSVVQAGLSMTVFLVSAIAVRPFTGLIIEKLGKKKTFYISESIFCLFSFIYIFAQDLNTLLIIRFFHGIWFSILTTVAVPIVNDFIPNQRKGEGMGYFVMSINLGIVLGPLLGLTLIQYISYTSVSFILACSILFGFIACFAIKIPKLEIKNNITKPAFNLTQLFEIKTIPAAIIAMLTSFSYASIMSFISNFTDAMGMLQYTSTFFVVFAISMMSLRPITGKLYDRKGAAYVIYPALISYAIGLLVLSQTDSVFGLMCAAILVGIGFGSAQPCIQTLAIQLAPKDRIGHATSTYFTFYDIGIAAGSLILGLVVTQFSFQNMYITCACVTIFSVFLFSFLFKKNKIHA